MDQGICEMNTWRHLKQHNFVACGPYCVKMVLDYWGIDKSIDEICKLCNYCAQGTLETGLVLGLTKAGVDAKLYMTPDGDAIKAEYKEMDSKRLATTLRRRSGRSRREVSKRGFAELAETVENRQVVFDILSQKTMEYELNLGNPWIVVVKPFSLYGFKDNKKNELLHFVVICGYDNDYFYIHDPSENEASRVSRDTLLYSMYSGEGRAICVKKK